MSQRIANVWLEADNGLEICYAVPFAVSPYRPATYLDPPEGGPEPDGEPWVCETRVQAASGRVYSLQVEEGSDTDHAAREVCPLSEERAWEAILERCEEIADDNDAAYEAACESGYRGPKKSPW